MIGTRPALVAAVGVVAVAIGLGGGAPRPELASGADALVAGRIQALRDGLDALDAELEPALDAARRGAALVVAGQGDPGPKLSRAADLLAAAIDAAVRVRRDTGALGAVLRARDPASHGVPAAPDPSELAGIAAQLDGAAEAATAFAGTRRLADDVTIALDEALAALDANDLDAAASAVGRARTDHDAVADAGIGAVTLPVWLSTTDAMIDAVERIVEATRAGDAAAAAQAADDFAALSGEADAADRALRIAIGEGGGAVTEAPLQRFAAVLDDVAALRAALPEPGRPGP
jgi:hypothetical protein